LSPPAAVVTVTLCATACTSLSTALKHRSAGQTSHTHRPNLRELVTFVVETTRHPLWLAALVADGVGFGLQVTALHLGALAVVQPLMVTALVFSLVLNHWVAGTRVSAREVSASAVLVAALVGFLLVSGASSPDVTGPPQPADRRDRCLGLLLAQLAFQAGPLRSSLPSIATVDPLASIVLGILVYDEHVRHGPGALTAEVLCLALLCATAIYLSRIRASEPAGVVDPRTAADGSVTAADH
jgi:drug/metabolite transporter (DMT)-like permease